MEEILAILFLFIVISTLLCFLLTCLALFQISSHSGNPDNRWLGLSYLSMVILLLYFLFAEDMVLFYLISFLIYFFGDIFIHNSFYKDRKSPVKIIVGIHLAISIVRTIIGYTLSNWNILDIFNLTLSNMGAFLIFGWLGMVSRNTSRNLEQYDIQPWIRKRASLVSNSAFIGMLQFIPDLVAAIFHIPNQDTTNPISLFLFGLQFFCLFLFALGQYFAWVMPEWFKRRLNSSFSKKQQEAEELSETEIEQILTGEGENRV